MPPAAVQQDTCGHRGRAGDPIYSARRTLNTGSALLAEKRQARLDTLFANEAHVEVETTWGIYQAMIAAYRHPDCATGRTTFADLIEGLGTVPTALKELRKLGRTLTQRTADTLAYFGRPGTSNGPIEATNDRLENVRGTALGSRNLTHYIARSLLHSGGLRTRPHPRM